MKKGTNGNKGKGNQEVLTIENTPIIEIEIDADSAHMGGNVEALSLSKAQANLQKGADWAFENMGIDQLIPSDKVLKFVINTESESQIRRNCKGYFNPEAYEDSKTGEIIGVINIVPEMFKSDYNDTPLKQRLLQTIIHEMSHAVNSLNGIVDCTKKAHNKKFAHTAELAGLIATKGTKAQGWALTTLSEQAHDLIEQGFDFDETAFEIFARDLKGISKNKPNRAKAVRWECPEGCGTDDNNMGFRTTSTQDFNIACMNCSDIDNTKGKGSIDHLVMYVKIDIEN